VPKRNGKTAAARNNGGEKKFLKKISAIMCEKPDC
jgi:hypothetical protein